MRWVKRQEASELVLIVLVSAVGSLLLARLFLKITDFYQFSHGNWHIAHVLWGGLIMFTGTMLTLTLHGGRIRWITAVVFGFGFGWFIDEIGKFLTRDNNYFFQPAIIFIYIFFVGIYLLYRYLEKIQPKDPKSLLYQVINKLEEFAEGDFEKSEKRVILGKLTLVKKEGGEIGYFAKELRRLIVKLRTVEDKGDGLIWKWWQKITRFGYHKVFKRKTVLLLLAVLAGIYIIEGIISTIKLAMNFRAGDLLNIFYGGDFVLTKTNVRILTLKIAADAMTGLMFLAGLLMAMGKKRMRAINYFQRGLLINIFLTSVFRFYFEQFSGVFGLFTSIGLYIGLGRLKKEI